MNNKEILERIGKIKNNTVREMMLNSFNNSSPSEKKKIDKLITSYENKLKNDLNFRAKVIAAYIRYNMEDFHCKYLTDAQMKELNPIIRNAVYTFLKDDADRDFFGISGLCAFNLPSYWEDCEYIRETECYDFDDEKDVEGEKEYNEPAFTESMV